jgi:putative DNA primase/helicase
MVRATNHAQLRKRFRELGPYLSPGQSQQQDELNGWCPVHEADGGRHRSPSASFNLAKDLWHCHSKGCDKAYRSRISLLLQDLNASTSAAVYPYTDEEGSLLFEVIRKPGKKFSQRRPDGKGGHIYSLNGTRRVLYHLPQLLEAIENGEDIFIPEGERDVEAIEAAGGFATCNPGGAGKWNDDLTEMLKGAVLVHIIADKDAPGRKHAVRVAASLEKVGIQYELVQARLGKDAADHLAAGHGLGDFIPFERARQGREDTKHRTDTGNARRLVAMYKDKILFCPAHKAWYIWSGRHWARDERLTIQALAKDTVGAMYEQAAHIQDEEERKRAASWALRSDNQPKLDAMVKNAQSEVAISPTELNADPMLLNVENGTINLRTGKLQPHNPKDLITVVAPVEYQPEAVDERWEEVLDRFVRPDDGKEEFLQRAAFASFTGNVSDKAFLNLFDEQTGNTGKTTFIESLLAVLGEYGAVVTSESFLKQSGMSIRSDLAHCDGKRMVVSSEIPAGRKLDVELLKKLTAGAGRYMFQRKYENSYENTITFTIWLDGNTVAKAPAEDDPLFGRWRLTPFKHQITAPDKKWMDRALGSPDYRAAVLAWVMRGRRAWLKNGMGSAPSVEKATTQVRELMDPLSEFWRNECRFGRDEYFTSNEALGERLDDWYARNPQAGRRINDGDFRALLRAKGAWTDGKSHRVKGRVVRGWFGIKLRR